MEKDGRISSSFRDPSGFVFCKNGEIYRQIQPIYRETYRLIQEKRLFEILWEEQLLVPHREVKNDASKIVIQPDRIPYFLSLRMVVWAIARCRFVYFEGAKTAARKRFFPKRRQCV
ncbi:MAG: hypothetical protein J6Z25_00275 [Opitutales bacterium]|nr:hypothetical protein [Opitutales bacterium]